MNFSFKKFIPKVMQETKWGSLTEVWQSIYVDIKNDKIKAIFNQYDFDNITEQELRDLAVMLGFNLKTLNGYTSTLNFIKKEMLFLIPRLKTKTTPTCYQLQGIPFNIIANGYSIIYDNNLDKYIGDETLIGSDVQGTVTLDREDKNYTYMGSLINLDNYINLDNSPFYYMDTLYRISIGTYTELAESYLDFYEFPTLDGSSTLYSLTRNILFNYTHKFVESATEFISLNTLKVLKSDIDQFKRMTDRCYYEPYLHFDLNSDHSITNKTWTDYLGVATATQKNILIENSFTDWSGIRFGTSAHSVITTSITDVNNYSFSWDYRSGTNKIIETDINYTFRLLITEMQKITEFTELAVINMSGTCVLYSTFPKVQWDEGMYNNLKFEFKII